MPNGFEAVEAYLSHIENMSFSVKTEPDFYDDQQVPLVDGETMFPVKAEPQDFTGPFYTTDPFTFGEEGRLPPVASLRCTPVDVSDQQLTGDTSHIQLLDLDQVTTEQPFYPDNFDKQQSSVPTGCQDYGYDSQSPNSLIFGELVVQDAVESLLTTVRDEIERACAALHIPPAPTLWTAEQTRSWATLILQKNGHPTHEASMFQLPGSRLCQLSQDDFRSLSPSFGELFYNQLEIWNNWCYYEQTSQFTTEMPMTTESSYSSGYPEMVSHPAPSVSPAPSSCSMDSLGSSSGSSTGFPAQHTQFDFLNTVLDSEPRPERKVRHSEHKQTIHLWQFLKELLVHAPSHGNCIKWLDREKGIFKIEDSSRVATLWGKRKNRPAMNYDKLSRSIRQYYKKGIIKKTEHSKRLVYQFCKPYL